MLTGKKLGLQERFLIKLENIEHRPLNASQNLKILSPLSQVPNLGYFSSKIYETVKKNLRFM